MAVNGRRCHLPIISMGDDAVVQHKTLHVISHTHWDREWYLTFQQFRRRLVDLVDRVVILLETDERFKAFHLDAQTIVLEDYLKIRPYMESKLKELISAGKLLVGPWYQLNDEYLTSGEATVRSLLLGSRIAEKFGGCMKVGYLPDQFGNIGQMPQIMRQFNIDNCIFGRGYQLQPGDKAEFIWQSPDGSRVLAILMPHWYNNAQHLPTEPQAAKETARHIADALGPLCNSSHLLLMNGVDHLEAQYDLGDAIEAMSSLADEEGIKVIHSTLPQFVQAVKSTVAIDSLKTANRELRDDNGGAILAGTLSTRMYLKQLNHHCQVSLERLSEPLSSVAYSLGSSYDKDFLRYAWKLLMENHPHDSICGCSIDQVHREMVPRFEQVLQVSGEMIDIQSAYIAEKVNTANMPDKAVALVVFNTIPQTRSEVVEATVEFPIGPIRRNTVRPEVDAHNLGDIPWMRLVDSEGRDIPFKVVSTSLEAKRVLAPSELPMMMSVRRFDIRFSAESLPSMGHTTYFAVPSGKSNTEAPVLLPRTLENKYLRAYIESDGTVTLTDKVTGNTYFGLNGFSDDGDAGDEYRYIPPTNNSTVTNCSVTSIVLESNGPEKSTYRIDMQMLVPATTDRNGRSKVTLPLDITTWISLAANARRLEIKTQVNNGSEYHRLRAIFPTSCSSDKSFAASQFDLISRPKKLPTNWVDGATTHPQQEFCAVVDSITQKGLAIFNKGLPEYELIDDDKGTLALTLLRCVGALTLDDASPKEYDTPEAQCKGTYMFEYAICPFSGSALDADIFSEARNYNTPVIVRQTGRHNGEFPMKACWLELIDNCKCIFSTLKVAEDDNTLILRFFNPTDARQSLALRFGTVVKGVNNSNLDEVTGEPIMKGVDGAYRVLAGPHSIVTLKVTP